MNDETLNLAIDLIARVEGIAMDPDDLVEDVMLMASVWRDTTEFLAAAAATARALEQVAKDQVDAAPLRHDLAGWMSYHFQHVRAQGARADMRIAYRREGDTVYVRAFGHREIPLDFYRRLRESR